MNPMLPSNEDTDQIAEFLRELLETFDKPRVSPKTFWDTVNLWHMLLLVEGQAALDRYRAIKVLLAEDNLRPIADLTRPIVETAFTIDYIADDDQRLREYAEWQLNDFYHRVLKRMQNAPVNSGGISTGINAKMVEMEQLLGDKLQDKAPRQSWKRLNELVTFTDSVPDQTTVRNRIYQRAGTNLSRSLHTAWIRVNVEETSEMAQLFFIMTAHRIARISLRHSLANTARSDLAHKIMNLCPSDV